jgi:hypothetical protein
MEVLSSQEFVELQAWTQENYEVFPGEMGDIQQRLLSNYYSLLKEKSQSLQNLKLLRQAMGLIPKSEKGNQEKY